MLALTLANLKMLARNRQTTFWALFFPLILVAVFGLFDLSAGSPSDMAVVDQAQTPASRQLLAALGEIPLLQLELLEGEAATPAAARRLAAEGAADYLLLIPPGFAAGAPPVPVTLMQNGNDEERNQLVSGILQGSYAGALREETAAPPPRTVIVERLETRQVSVSYFDLVLLGLVGMGIMTNAIISGAVRISNYRNLSILKRMQVTSLPIWKFFAAEITAQLVLALVQAGIILAVGVFVFRAQLHGNVLYLLPIVALGSLIFLNIGFIISAWANTPAAAAGMGNSVAFPMMFFAGTFFSTSTLPWLLPYAAEALPLAPMLVALREVALYEASLWQVWPQLAILAGWVAATALAAIRVFRFS